MSAQVQNDTTEFEKLLQERFSQAIAFKLKEVADQHVLIAHEAFKKQIEFLATTVTLKLFKTVLVQQSKDRLILQIEIPTDEEFDKLFAKMKEAK